MWVDLGACSVSHTVASELFPAYGLTIAPDSLSRQCVAPPPQSQAYTPTEGMIYASRPGHLLRLWRGLQVLMLLTTAMTRAS